MTEVVGGLLLGVGFVIAGKALAAIYVHLRSSPSIWQDVWVQEGNHHRERIVDAAMNWKNDKKNSKEELRAAVKKFEEHLNEITDGRDPFAPVKVVKREEKVWKPLLTIVSEVERHPFSCQCALCVYLENNYPDLAVQVLSRRRLR